MADKSFDAIIIGGGPAGMAAAVYMARQKLNFAFFTGELGGQVVYSTDIENYLGIHDVSGVEMVQKFQEHVEEYKKSFDIFENEKVTQIKKAQGGYQIFTEKSSHTSKSILIVTGAKHRMLKVPGEEKLKGKGVTYCATCDAPIFMNKAVAVVGGGNSAMESALLAEKYSTEVHMIVLGDALKGEDIVKKKIRASEKIHIHFEAKTIRIEGEDTVSGLVYADTDGNEQIVSVQGVFIEIGLIPVSDFIDLVEKNKRGEIVVDKMNRTNVEGIWAAGDVTDIMTKQIAIAVGEGSKAALGIIRYLQSQDS